MCLYLNAYVSLSLSLSLYYMYVCPLFLLLSLILMRNDKFICLFQIFKKHPLETTDWYCDAAMVRFYMHSISLRHPVPSLNRSDGPRKALALINVE